ncbi:phosphatidate cytidylyltransferase [Arcticibacter pallidicorallinus]|uniref:Phosphatidate cytidylyltransferase n=1 Tax=Arcticibacter pallidicorallinus TaxID=1259464 RepID=A0A2T0U7E2_9SPHI|nr:CDP-archaeol synthase [Arcticibacter pallidicorallinus]PRY53841.1 phosphatidate cytidylyltransferase [Arcticibacter pallidicorallinus]
MKTRAITGFFFVSIMLGSVLLGEKTFAVFFLILSMLCLDEFYRLVKKDVLRPQRITGALLGLSVFSSVLYQLMNGETRYLLLIVPIAVAVFIFELYRKTNNPFQNLAFTFTGVIFTVIPFCFYAGIGFIEGIYNFHYSLGFLILLWSSDTGAYLFGRSLGKNKLFKRHSPKKTWEGFFGGMIVSLLAAFILSTQFTGISYIHWAIISLIIVVGGTLGDLCESMLKRSFDVKDSGSLLPGHGGVLDRFDGLFIAAPLVYVYLVIFTT